MLRRLLSFLQKRPEAEVTLVHPRLGPLKFVEGIWYGQAPLKPEIEITIIGNERGPDEKQAEHLLECLQAFGAIEQKMQNFLSAELASDPKVKVSDFQIQSLDFLWPKEDDYFVVELKSKWDEYGLWRLEFVNGEPKFLGRDD
jgi:hypothetical protein